MRALDLTGQRFGKLEVIKREKIGKKNLWLCDCDCGRSCHATTGNLRAGYKKSCGCLREYHNESKTRLYRVWKAMKQRCYNPNYTKYENYGGRGIKVCNQWKNSFEAFKEWAVAHGYENHLQIDRMDNNGNYEPANCRYRTNQENSQNTRENTMFPARVLMIKKTLKETKWPNAFIAEIFGTDARRVSEIKHGEKWSNLELENNEYDI